MARSQIRWIIRDASVLNYTSHTLKLVNDDANISRFCETRAWQRLNGT